jgi:hypothetical protein
MHGMYRSLWRTPGQNSTKWLDSRERSKPPSAKVYPTEVAGWGDEKFLVKAKVGAVTSTIAGFLGAH